MGNEELLKLYSQLDDMEQTKEVKQIKKQIKESLYYSLRKHYLELSSIGGLLGMTNSRMSS